MNCPKCDSTNRPGAPACRRCTTALPRSCAGCGTAISNEVELCINCRTERIPAALGAELLDAPADSVTERSAALPARGEPHFVGRTALLEKLIEHAQGKTEGLRFVAVLGAAGMGKSRLAAELDRRLTARAPDTRVLRSIAGGPGAPPFAAFRRLLSERIDVRIDEGENEAQARDQISRVVTGVVGKSRALEVIHLIAQLLGCPFPDSPVVQPLAESPAQLESRTFIAVRRFFAADAARGPITIIIDDIDRASSETINLLHYVAAGLQNAPVLIVCIGRPELFEVHPTFGDGDVSLERMELGPLVPDEAVELLGDWLQGAALPTELMAHVRERMVTTPRSIESLVRYLREAGVMIAPPGSEAQARFDTTQLRQLALPRDLAGVVSERLRLMATYERDLLEKAAACGEAFWLDAVVALVRSVALEHGDPDGPTLGEVAAAGDRTRAEVGAALHDLAQRGLLVEEPVGLGAIAGEREFRFAAPPWREVVYEGIPDERRRRYHRLVAQWLELRPRGRGEEEQEEIGRHLERAGDGPSAAQRFRRAADGARARFYNDKAIRLYVNALGCLGQHDLASRIHLWHDLGSVFQLKGDFDSALGAFERMLRLSWVVASRTKAAVAFNKMGRIYRQQSELPLALEYLQRGLELFEQAADTRGVAGSLDDIGQVLWLMSRYEEALDRSAAALETRRQLGDKRSIAASLMHIGNIERHRGLFDEAEACYKEALELRVALSDWAGIIESHNGLGMLSFHRGDIASARTYWQSALQRAEQIGAAPLEALLLNHLGETARATGQLPEARKHFESARKLAAELEDRRLLCEALYNLGLLELAEGHGDEALARCNEALQLAEAAGIRVDIGRALLALGEVHGSTLFDDTGLGPRTAESYFTRGVELFREIGNDAELGQALMRFGTYRVEHGQGSEGEVMIGEARLIFARLGMQGEPRLLRASVDLEHT